MKLSPEEFSALIAEATSQNDTSDTKSGIASDTDAADSLIAPFKTKYLFHCQDLLGTASITIFDLAQLYELTPKRAILKGGIVFNGKILHGKIIVDLTTEEVFYNYQTQNPSYKLFIDPSKRDLWNKLVGELRASISARATQPR